MRSILQFWEGGFEEGGFGPEISVWGADDSCDGAGASGDGDDGSIGLVGIFSLLTT